MTQQINLFNPIFLTQKKYFSAVTMVQALGLILAGSLLLGVYTRYQVSTLSDEAQTTSAQLASTQAQMANLNAAFNTRKKSALIEEEIQKTENEIRAMQQVLNTVGKGDFGNTRGYAEYMRAFARQIVNGVWLTGFSVSGAGSEIALQGRALKPELVPGYIGRLKREPAMQGKSFASLEVHAPPPERAGNAATGEAKRLVAVPYVDFNLQSYREHQGQTESPGVKTR